MGRSIAMVGHTPLMPPERLRLCPIRRWPHLPRQISCASTPGVQHAWIVNPGALGMGQTQLDENGQSEREMPARLAVAGSRGAANAPVRSTLRWPGTVLGRRSANDGLWSFGGHGQTQGQRRSAAQETLGAQPHANGLGWRDGTELNSPEFRKDAPVHRDP